MASWQNGMAPSLKTFES